MKILYIGGTGEISFSCVLESLALGHDVSVFNRGQTEQALPAAVRQIAGDLGDAAGYARLGEQRFDVVCQFYAFDPARVEKDLETFGGRTGQYVFMVRKNSGDTTVTCTISGAATSCSDSTHSVAFSAGDTIAIKSTPSGGPTARRIGWTAKFTPS